MSDSGRTLGMCEHAKQREWCVECLRAERDRLRAAITTHHSQHADDLCWMDDNALYEAAGLPPRDNSVGDPEAMLANCKRFIAQRCKGGGEWKSYAQLERERDGLVREVERLRKEITGTDIMARQNAKLCSFVRGLERDNRQLRAEVERLRERAGESRVDTSQS